MGGGLSGVVKPSVVSFTTLNEEVIYQSPPATIFLGFEWASGLDDECLCAQVMNTHAVL